MDFQKLDSIFSEFISNPNNQIYVQSLNKTVPICMEILKKNIPSVQESWSRTFEINDSINLIIGFLNSIDKDLASQFLNVIHSVNEKGEPIVNLIPKTNDIIADDRLDHKTGKVFIHYDNTPNDMFLILHEVLHKLNQSDIINSNDELVQTFAREYFTETVSITGEMLLGNYLVDSGIITENDFELIKRHRLMDAKEWARNVIIQNELLKIKSQGMQLTRENILELFNNYDRNSPFYPILLDEFRDLRRISQILSDGHLDIPISQRYVIAQNIAENFVNSNNYTINDFLNLHYALANPNTDISEILQAINRKQPNKYIEDFSKIQELMGKTMDAYCTEFLEKKGIESPLSEKNIEKIKEQLIACVSDKEYAEIVNSYLQSFHQGHLFLKESDETKPQDDKQVFPLIVKYEDGKYIGVSNDANIDGQEISEINGIPITKYVQAHTFDQGHRTFSFDKDGILYNPEFQINEDTCTLTMQDGTIQSLETISTKEAIGLKKQEIANEQKELGIKLAEGIDGNELLSNVVCGYTRDGIPYIKIRKFDRNSKDADKIKIGQFAGQLKDREQTDLIIDIRGNGGGTDEYIGYLGAFSDSDYERQEQFKSLIGLNGKEANEVFGQTQDIDTALERLENNPTREVAKYPYTSKIPNGNSSITHRLLLIDGRVFSSADKFTKLAKDSGFATVVGSQPTAGDGEGFTTYSVDTPILREQGLSITMPSSMGLDFSEFQTIPDIMVNEHDINTNLGQIMEQTKNTIIEWEEAPITQKQDFNYQQEQDNITNNYVEASLQYGQGQSSGQSLNQAGANGQIGNPINSAATMSNGGPHR